MVRILVVELGAQCGGPSMTSLTMRVRVIERNEGASLIFELFWFTNRYICLRWYLGCHDRLNGGLVVDRYASDNQPSLDRA